MYSKMITSISNFSPELEIQIVKSNLIHTLFYRQIGEYIFLATLNPNKQSTLNADIQAAKP